MRTMSGCVLSTIRWRTAVWPEGLQDRTMAKLVSVFVNRATAGWSGSDGRETDERLGYHNNCNTNEGSKCRASIGDMSFCDCCTLLTLDSIHPCSWRLAKTRPLNSAFEKVEWAAHSTPIKLAARRLKATRRPIKQ